MHECQHSRHRFPLAADPYGQAPADARIGVTAAGIDEPCPLPTFERGVAYLVTTVNDVGERYTGSAATYVGPGVQDRDYRRSYVSFRSGRTRYHVPREEIVAVSLAE